MAEIPGIHINLIGYNEKGLIGFIDGTYELIYIEKPVNWETLVATLKLPYILKENVREVNKAGKEAAKNAEKENRTVKDKVHNSKGSIGSRRRVRKASSSDS